MTSVGRRSGSPDTRSQILDAARTVFSVSGYDKATMRAIATKAQVDPALIYHYFGNKEQLFAATIDLPVDLSSIGGVFDSDNVGRSIAELFFSIWEVETARTSLLGIIRSAAAGEEQAVRAFRQFLTKQLQDNLASVIDSSDADLRALAVASHLVGLAMTRYVMKLEPIASASLEEIVDLVAPRLDSYLRP